MNSRYNDYSNNGELKVSMLHKIEDLLQRGISCKDISEELNLELSLVEGIYRALRSKMSSGH